VPDERREDAILDLALPHLGAFACCPRRVKEEIDAEHLGHTFDYAGVRLDGRRVAIEVTEATEPSFRRDSAALEHWERRITGDLVDARVGPGRYLLSSESRSSPSMKALRKRIANSASRLNVGGEVEVAPNAWLCRQDGGDDLVRFYWGPSTGGQLDLMHESLFRSAITDCRSKLRNASEDGYEAMLLMEPFWLGSVDSWHTAMTALERARILDNYPGSVWAVSLQDMLVEQLH
jgi:hypothetical protein